jgi:hypothetical protein
MGFMTAFAQYFATGEGITYMVVISPAYGSGTPAENITAEFTERFGDYMAQGIEIEEGIFLDFDGSDFLITDRLRALFEDWQRGEMSAPGNAVFSSSFHVNYS